MWEMRGVNGKGMDLRYKVPEWIDGLEAGIRAQVGAAMTRGNIMLTLKVVREADGEGSVRLNRVALGSVLQALHDVEQAAMAVGVTLAQANPADVLAVRGNTSRICGAIWDSRPAAAALALASRSDITSNCPPMMPAIASPSLPRIA